LLEVRNLTKIYKAKVKNGADTHALDGVSLRFPERGMVFLLGKSGSGKSTLLNVCGGLDAPTDGEIIVKGRSSKDFSQSDFDSYRNTYVGFIFQEYNILNEFTVEDNIALALELQGKPKDKKAIAALLEQVDLSGFAKRKPNTLSGGQKQRIAIARALIKSPEIIMADEPTGALDSATGKQVFDTLKKLSSDKLVIVVSHDREFAELYADRIIELKDGKILSDVTKTEQQKEALSENISVLGDVLCLKGGAELTEDDFSKIRSYLHGRSGDVIIAGGERDVQSFKKANRMTDEGTKEIFADTEEGTLPRKDYRPEDSRFLRSKLPVKHALKIGVSGLKSKPVRLFFTIVLCVVAFVLFGLLSTLNFYDSEATFKQTMRDGGPGYIATSVNYRANVKWYEGGRLNHEYETVYTAELTEEDLDELRREYGKNVFGASAVHLSLPVRTNPAPYWIPEVHSIAFLPEDHELRSTIEGRYPEAATEICLSQYIAQSLVQCTVSDTNGKAMTLNTPSDLLGKKLVVGNKSYTVVGIIPDGEIDPKFDALKDSESAAANPQLEYQLRSVLENGLHTTAFLHPSELLSVSKMYGAGFKGMMGQTYLPAYVGFEGRGDSTPHQNSTYAKLSELAKDDVVYLDSSKSGAVVTAQQYAQAVYAKIDDAREEQNNRIDEYQQNNQPLPFEPVDYTKLEELCNMIMMGGKWQEVNPDDPKGETTVVPLSSEEFRKAFSDLLAELDAVLPEAKTVTFTFSPFDVRSNVPMDDGKSFTVGGVLVANVMDSNIVYLPDADAEAAWELQKASISYEEAETKYEQDPNGLYTTVFLPFDGSETQIDSLWSIYSNKEYGEDDSRMHITDSRVSTLLMVDETVESLSKVFLYVGLVLAVFAILLFSNFISVSISQKKKEIGILRAVGARSLDVFKIFFSESFTIAFICTVLSTAGSIVLCNVLNAQLGEMLGASLFVFGLPSFIILVGIAILTAVLATFLPVRNAARKKPVESIRAL